MLNVVERDDKVDTAADDLIGYAIAIKNMKQLDKSNDTVIKQSLKSSPLDGGSLGNSTVSLEDSSETDDDSILSDAMREFIRDTPRSDLNSSFHLDSEEIAKRVVSTLPNDLLVLDDRKFE